jgi:hypothetical protein
MCSLPFFLIRRSSPSHVETILLSFPKPLQSYTFALLHRSFSFAVYTMYRAQQRKTSSSIQTATVDTMSRVQQKKGIRFEKLHQEKQKQKTILSKLQLYTFIQKLFALADDTGNVVKVKCISESENVSSDTNLAASSTK